MGCDVYTATDGAGAIKQAMTFHPDVIVLDLAMPHVDGWAAAERLRPLAGHPQHSDHRADGDSRRARERAPVGLRRVHVEAMPSAALVVRSPPAARAW